MSKGYIHKLIYLFLRDTSLLYRILINYSTISTLILYCCSYSLISFVASTIQGAKHHEHVSFGVRSSTRTGQIFDILNGCGTIAFAFAGHSVALEIQATIPSTPEKPSKIAMWKGVVVAYILVALCYVSVSVSGYWAYGRVVEDDVLISLDKPAWLIAAANLMVFFHVIGSYQVKFTYMK